MTRESDGYKAIQIGDLGEIVFREACVVEGLNCSKLEPDRTGKDFIVEWRHSSKRLNHTYDTRPSPRRCLVQVKGAGATRPEVRLKLSAVEWLAKDDQPAFVVAPLFRNKVLTEYLMFHVRGPVLETILKRLREAERDGESLTKFKMTLPVALGERVPRDSEQVRLWLERHIPEDLHAYALAKNKERSELGYSGRGDLTMKVSFKVRDPSHIIDLVMGERTLDAEMQPPQDVRFDIALPVKPFSMMAGSVKLSVDAAPTQRWIVSAKDADGNILESIEGGAKVGAISGMPVEFWRAEFSNGFLSVRLQDAKISVDFGGDEVWDTRRPLSELRKTISLWRHIAVNDAQLEITRGPGSVPLSVKPNPTDSARHDEWTRPVLKVLELAAELFSFCGVSDPEVTVDALWDNRKDLVQAARKISLRQDSERPLALAAPATPELLAGLHEGPRQLLLQTLPVVLGPDVFAVAVSYAIEMSQEGDDIKFVSHARFPIEGQLLDPTDVYSAYDVFVEKLRIATRPMFHMTNPLLDGSKGDAVVPALPGLPET